MQAKAEEQPGTIQGDGAGSKRTRLLLRSTSRMHKAQDAQQGQEGRTAGGLTA